MNGWKMLPTISDYIRGHIELTDDVCPFLIHQHQALANLVIIAAHTRFSWTVLLLDYMGHVFDIWAVVLI